MTGFTAILRTDRRVDVVIRRAVSGAILERKLLKQALETRRYGMKIRGAVKTNWHYTSIAAMELHAAHRIAGVMNAEFLLMYDGPR